jgi:putative ABC transport system permease protein
MKFPDALDLATRNLRESVLRNSLTTLGIAVGVASLVAMLSLGIGLQQLANRRLTRSGLFDTIIVTSKRDFDFDHAHGRPRDTNAAQSRVLDVAARDEISNVKDVIEATPDIRFMTEVRYNNEPNVAGVSGLAPSARQNESFDNMQGNFFSGPDAQEAILLADFAKQLDPQNPSNVIGKDLTVVYAERQPMAPESAKSDDSSDWGFTVTRHEQNLRIVGIVQQQPYGGFRGMAHSSVFLPIQLAEKLNVMQGSDLRGLTRDRPGTRNFASISVRVNDPTRVQAVEDKIKALGFGTFSLLDATREMRRFFAVLDAFLGIFGSLALAVASLGIINTLVMAILERRREIGIMKAIGASDQDVRRLFFAEAGAMGVVGGALGVALGWAIGRVINFGTNIYLTRQQLPTEHVWVVPWWLVLGAVGFSIAVTLLSGLYPASRAAKLDPIQALRYE